MNNDNTIPALDKALSLLESLGRGEDGATQAELSAKLEISQSTCYRILQTLLAHDFVRKQGGRFDLSGGLLGVSMRLVDRAKRFERAQPVLEDLSSKTGFSSKLSIRQGFEQISILRAESPLAVSVSGKVGARFPLVEGSVGAALLCDDDEESLSAALAACKEEIEEKRAPELLRRRLAQLRAEGFALNAQANRWNVEAMSVPVRGSGGETLAALTLIGFTDEFKDVSKLGDALTKAAKRISSAI